jgi:NAD(P)-dependent dehydrogenase (short-subunit alcohol dehydrogenase family)
MSLSESSRSRSEAGSRSGELAGRVALVTGAGRGIGRAVAARLHRGGAAVALCGRSRPGLESLAAELGDRVAIGVLDVGDRASVDAEVPRLARELGGRLDIIVNNAGVNGPTPLDASDDAMWHAIIDVNLHGPMYVTRAALPFLQSGSSVINISSVLGKMGVPYKGAYCAAKHGIIGFARAVQLEVREQGITVSCVSPGPTATRMGSGDGSPYDRAAMLEPEDVADAIVFVATRPARVIIPEIEVRPRAYL